MKLRYGGTHPPYRSPIDFYMWKFSESVFKVSYFGRTPDWFYYTRLSASRRHSEAAVFPIPAVFRVAGDAEERAESLSLSRAGGNRLSTLHTATPVLSAFEGLKRVRRECSSGCSQLCEIFRSPKDGCRADDGGHLSEAHQVPFHNLSLQCPSLARDALPCLRPCVIGRGAVMHLENCTLASVTEAIAA